MIQSFVNKKLLRLLYFIKDNPDNNFYFTENNVRKYISNEKDLIKLIKISKYIYVSEENDEINGVILVWVSLGNNIKRYFIKINAINEKVANDLLTVLSWNCNNILYIKIRKNSKFLNVFRDKNFYFCGDRGNEILLTRNQSFKKVQNEQYKTEDKISS